MESFKKHSKLKRWHNQDWHPFYKRTYLSAEAWKTWDKSQEASKVKFTPASIAWCSLCG